MTNQNERQWVAMTKAERLKYAALGTMLILYPIGMWLNEHEVTAQRIIALVRLRIDELFTAVPKLFPDCLILVCIFTGAIVLAIASVGEKPSE